MYGYTTFHDKIIDSLISNVRRGKNANAYIFEGEEGLFTRECARLFAQSLVCAHPQAAPCCSCPNCEQAKASSSPDIIFINEGLNKLWFGKERKSVGVEIIRRVNDEAFIKPFNSPRKVYIIEDGAAMGEAAQNAFLKTLEEPPEFTVFIILVSSASVLLDTVISRCALIHFNTVTADAVRAYLNEKYPDRKDEIEFLARYCGGVPGKAEELLNDEGFLALRTEALNKLPALLSRRSISAFDIKDYLEENKDSAEEIFTIWISYLRDLLVMHYSDENILNTDKSETLASYCLQCSAKTAVIGIEECTKALEMLRRYVSLKSVALRTALVIKERMDVEMRNS